MKRYLLIHMRLILCLWGCLTAGNVMAQQPAAPQECDALIDAITAYYQSFTGWSQVYMRYTMWELDAVGAQSSQRVYEMWMTEKGICVKTPESWVGQSGGYKVSVSNVSKTVILQKSAEPFTRQQMQERMQAMIRSSHPDSLRAWCSAIQCWRKGDISTLSLKMKHRPGMEIPIELVEIRYDHKHQRVQGALYRVKTESGLATSGIEYHEISKKIAPDALPRTATDYVLKPGTNLLKPAFATYDLHDYR